MERVELELGLNILIFCNKLATVILNLSTKEFFIILFKSL
jgi:hypothetical protein